MQPKFRIAGEQDVRGIVELCNAVFEEDTAVEQAERAFRAMAADRNQVHIVGELDGKVIAYVKVTIIPTLSRELGTYAVLNHVCVAPDVRRGGIGTKLLDAGFAVAKYYGCKSVKLWSKNTRVAAHGLYHKYGFEVLDAKFFEKELENENR